VASIVFYVLALFSVFFGANVVFQRNPAICAVHLVGAFFCLSGIYLVLGFPFMAALQLLVYTGAIMVLFLFVIMLLDLRKEEPRETPIAALLAPLFAGALLAFLALTYPDFMVSPVPGGDLEAGIRSASGGKLLAENLFGRHVLAFEATSVLLLGAILGVVTLAKRRRSRKMNVEVIYEIEKDALARSGVSAVKGGQES
jgi:NADH-quinone oxidoreductase subunit J